MVVPLLGLHEQIFPRVSRPNQYIAPFSVSKNAQARVCLVYPGSSSRAFGHAGFSSLLGFLRDDPDRFAVDVACRPQEDLENLLREEGVPLFGFGSRWPLSEFDRILIYACTPLEMMEASRMLTLGGVEPQTSKRSGAEVLLAGPLALWGSAFGNLANRALPGDPECYRAEILEGQPGGWTSGVQGPETEARWLTHLPSIPEHPLLPLGDLEPEGLPLEMARPRGLEDAYYAADLLFRNPENAVQETERVLRSTGAAQVVWGGVWAGNHPELTSCLERLHQRVYEHHQTVRVDQVHPSRWTPGLARELNKGRRGGLRLVPLALSEALRDRGGAPLTQDKLRQALELASRGGWQFVDIRFLVGVPGETDADRQEFETVLGEWTDSAVRKGLPKLRITLQPYVPKPLTPGEASVPMDPSAYASWVLGVTERFKKASRMKIAAADVQEAWASYHLLRGSSEGLAALEQAAAGEPSREFSAGQVEGNAPKGILVGALPEETPEPVAPRRAPVLAAGRSGGRRVRRGAPRHADRYRIRYEKDDRLRFAAHLEIIRALERGFVGAQIPLAWSQGKDPRPKLAFGPSLAVGMTSEAEYLDIVLSREVGEAFLDAVNACLPDGLRLKQSQPIRNEAASLGSSIDVAVYRVSFPRSIKEDHPSSQTVRTELETRVQEVLASDSVQVTKIKKEQQLTYNARPSILHAQVVQDPDGYPALVFNLRLNRPESIRPEALARVICNGLTLDERLFYVHRTGLFVSGSEGDLDPMQVIQRDFAWWRQASQRGVSQ